MGLLSTGFFEVVARINLRNPLQIASFGVYVLRASLRFDQDFRYSDNRGMFSQAKDSLTLSYSLTLQELLGIYRSVA